jgi:hypothetical protein
MKRHKDPGWCRIGDWYVVTSTVSAAGAAAILAKRITPKNPNKSN